MSQAAPATVSPAADSRVEPVHILIVTATGPVAHRVLRTTKAAAAQSARDTVALVAPGRHYELHWRRAFGRLWAIVFVKPPQEP